MIKFSTIMPVYNSQDKLKKSVESIINQTYENWELIIVDDGSTDNSYNICKEYSENDSRIKLFKKKNEGPGKARNYGISKSDGDYISFIDSDDYYELDYYETIEKEINLGFYDVVYFNLVMEDEDGKINKINNINKFVNMDKDQLIKLQMMGILSWGPCLKVIKSDIVKKYEFSELKVGEEALFSFDVLNESKQIGFVDKVLYHYVYNENGQHTKGGYDPWNEVVKILKIHLESMGLFEKYNKSLNGLALRALSISIYRYSNSNLSFLEKSKQIKQKINEYKRNYDINNIENELIDNNSKIILLLIKLKLYFLIIIASKVKSKKNK